MRSALHRIAWGLVLVFIDFRIVIDLLPDWIGLLLVVSGCSQAAGLAKVRYFIYTRNMALVLLGFTIIQIVMSMNTGQPAELNAAPTFDFPLLWLGVTMIANLIFIYLLCRSLYDYAMKLGHEDIGASAQTRWLTYLVVNTIILVLIPFTTNTSEQMVPVVVGLGLVSLIIALFIIGLLLKAAKIKQVNPNELEEASIPT